jgi:hypothetical protein
LFVIGDLVGYLTKRVNFCEGNSCIKYHIYLLTCVGKSKGAEDGELEGFVDGVETTWTAGDVNVNVELLSVRLLLTSSKLLLKYSFN